MEIKCPNCDKSLDLPENAVGRKVRCPFCQNTFVGEEPVIELVAMESSGGQFCPRCGARVPVEAKFCSQCGRNLAASGESESRRSSNKVVCAVCGKQVRESSAVKCSRCGKHVCKSHYDKKLDVCSLCAIDVKDELADKAVNVGISGDWNQAFSLAKQADPNDPRILYVFAHAYYAQVPSIAYHSQEYNAKKGREYLDASARAGYARAQYELVKFETQFEGVALPWLLKAAEQEYIPAQLHLGKQYEDGFYRGGVVNGLRVVDLPTAYKWYKRAATNGDAKACFKMYEFLSEGKGVESDPIAAHQWLEAAANKEYPAALRLMGDCYRTGNQTQMDMELALLHYQRAVECGDSISRKFLLNSIATSKYIAVDLRGGMGVDKFPVFEVNCEDEVTHWTDEWKTDYLLLRRINSGEFQTNEEKKQEFDPFYIGVFPITQAQWKAIMGANPSQFSAKQDSPMRPVEMVSHDMIKNESRFRKEEKRFIDVLREKTNLQFDLPTRAQQGYFDQENPNTVFAAALRSVNQVDQRETQPVGLSLPNLFGLYDVRGSVGEWNEEGFIGSESWRRTSFYGEDHMTWADYSFNDRKQLYQAYDVGFRVALLFTDWNCPKQSNS